MKQFVCSLLCLGLNGYVVSLAPAQTVTRAPSAAAQSRTRDEMTDAARQFLQTLSPTQRQQAVYPFADDERFNWHFVPRKRNGLPLKQMTPDQRRAAMVLLRTGLSAQGYEKATSIMDLENVLRVVENRPPNDTYRDPENYAFTIFGDPGSNEPWSWRTEGHHLSLQFVSMTSADKGGTANSARVLAQTPTFFGSNPGEVRADVPQKGKQILRAETELAFALLATLTADQRKQAVLAPTAYPDILTFNKRQASLERMDGLRLADMTADQRKLFLNLLQVYLGNYRVTLAKQQMAKLEQTGLDSLRFGWAGDLTPELGDGKGWYYRIHGPTILIEYDNTQNNANHIHTVVRDLTNDFGEDLLREHYRTSRHDKP